MQKYKKYHTNIKTSYALGIQKQVLPESFTKEISHRPLIIGKGKTLQRS